jgi:hypothetical protein
MAAITIAIAVLSILILGILYNSLYNTQRKKF